MFDLTLQAMQDTRWFETCAHESFKTLSKLSMRRILCVICASTNCRFSCGVVEKLAFRLFTIVGNPASLLFLLLKRSNRKKNSKLFWFMVRVLACNERKKDKFFNTY